MKNKTIKEFIKWLNEEDRQNWEIERYFETAIQSEKKKWKQEALKNMPEESHVDFEKGIDGDAYKYGEQAGRNQAIQECKKAVTDL